MKICDYSSLIFAGNTTVLLVLSLTTDYWEYRAFNVTRVVKTLADRHVSSTTRVILPFDTDSYIQIKVAGNLSADLPEQNHSVQQERLYHAPVFLIRRSVHVSQPNEFPVMNMTSSLNVSVLKEQEINLFQQYGNLFRDCDELESDVRELLGLHNIQPKRCSFHHSAYTSTIVYDQSSVLIHLESMAGACAVICIVCVCTGLVAGSCGLFSRYRQERAFYIASCSSLFAGFFLTIAIALFHGKCFILRKMELFPGQEVPYKDILEVSKIYSYGWSFMLAWLCVLFCYVSAYVWLCKAQGPSKLVNTRNSEDIPYEVVKLKTHIVNRDGITDELDIATI